MLTDKSARRIQRLSDSDWWDEQDAAEIVEAWRASGLELEEFARQFRLQPTRVRHWLKRLEGDEEDNGGADSVASVFYPVQLIADDEPQADQTLELIVEGGRRIAVRPGFSAPTLRRLIELVEAMAC